MKRTIQLIAQIAFSVLVALSIERYLNPHLNIKALLLQLLPFSLTPAPFEQPNFSKLCKYTLELIQNYALQLAFLSLFRINKKNFLVTLETSFFLPLFVSSLLGKYVTKRDLTSSLLLKVIQDVFNPLYLILYSIRLAISNPWR